MVCLLLYSRVEWFFSSKLTVVMLHQIVLRPQSLCQPEFELCARCDVRAPPPPSLWSWELWAAFTRVSCMVTKVWWVLRYFMWHMTLTSSSTVYDKNSQKLSQRCPNSLLQHTSYTSTRVWLWNHIFKACARREWFLDFFKAKTEKKPKKLYF